MTTTMNTTAPRPRRRWTEDEDRILRREANYQLQMGCLKDWNRIAAKVPGRTNKDCRKRWSKVCDNVKKGAWDSAEDERLQNAVRMYGFRWTQVAQMVGTRHADQCAKRWHHSLDPNVDHSEWKQEEDDRLLNAVNIYGRNWKIIGEKEFPGRSTTDIKNRYAIVSRKRTQSMASERTMTVNTTPVNTTFTAMKTSPIVHTTAMHSPSDSANSDGRYESPLPQLTHSSSASPYSPPGHGSFQVSPRTEHKPSIASSVGSQIHHEMAAAAAAAAVSGAHVDPMIAMDTSQGPQTQFVTPTTSSPGFVSQPSSANPFTWEQPQLLPAPSWSSEPVRMEHSPSSGMDSVNPVNVEDWGMVDAAEAANVSDPAELAEVGEMNGMKPPSQTTLIMEDVGPATLNSILDILFKTKTKVKLETLH